MLEAHGGKTELDRPRRGSARSSAASRRGPRPPPRGADAEQLPRWASAGEDEIVGRLLDAGVPVDSTGAADVAAD